MIGAIWDRFLAAADRGLPEHLREGRRGERLAYRYLKRNGYRVVARNYRTRSGRGEIDLLAWDGPHLACIEVKTRRTADFGRPEEFVDQSKQRQLISAAHEYARRAKVSPARLRFDVVSVTLEPELQIELYQDAFGEPGESRLGG